MVQVQVVLVLVTVEEEGGVAAEKRTVTGRWEEGGR